jgi:hypothetical protein
MKMFDLETEQLEDGTIRLSQMNYAGEDGVIDLHPTQLRLVAEQCGIYPTAHAWPSKGFIRDFGRARNVAGSLYNLLASVPKFPPSENQELDADEVMALDLLDRLDALHEDYLAGLGDETPSALPNAA